MQRTKPSASKATSKLLRARAEPGEDRTGGKPKMDLFKHDADLMLRPKKNGYCHLACTSNSIYRFHFVDFAGSLDSFF